MRAVLPAQMCRVITAVHAITWFSPLKTSLCDLGVQRCRGGAPHSRTGDQMWTDKTGWPVNNLLISPLQQWGKTWGGDPWRKARHCLTFCLSLISHVFALSFTPFFFFNQRLASSLLRFSFLFILVKSQFSPTLLSSSSSPSVRARRSFSQHFLLRGGPPQMSPK